MSTSRLQSQLNEIEKTAPSRAMSEYDVLVPLRMSCTSKRLSPITSPRPPRVFDLRGKRGGTSVGMPRRAAPRRGAEAPPRRAAAPRHAALCAPLRWFGPERFEPRCAHVTTPWNGNFIVALVLSRNVSTSGSTFSSEVSVASAAEGHHAMIMHVSVSAVSHVPL